MIEMKVIKSYSLDLQTVQMIENNTNGGVNSRSKLVDDAVKWYISGNVKELVDNNEALMEAVKRANQVIDAPKPDPKPWWKQILGF